ncbi:hypothetical protein [Sporosarcina sp. FA9]|uniref:hypothetical protein n=1 Tax=Sporosarcina sp. FA9 TaxID=3413030 RepID=UPI003F65AE8D
MGNDLEKVLTTLNNIENNQNEFSNSINTLENNQNRFASDLKNLDKKVDDLNLSFVAGLEPYFNNFEKQIDDMFDKLSSKIENQKNAIDVLSARSIQQEADINVLNRVVRNQ